MAMKDITNSHQTNKNRRYMPGLDGLRALSVIAVIAYHFNFKWASGGLLGVGIFFVLSGYLITDQIIDQWKRDKRLDLKQFWIRRARRLLPVMFVMLAFVAVWLILFDRSRLIALQGDFISVALYFNNWWLIFHNVSYFESFGPPSPIGHLWSLAIEEQFYLIWPLVLIIGLHTVKQRYKLILLTLVGAIVSALAMALIFTPGMDPSRVYYGTDTRVFALLIGAALAIAWPSQNISTTISHRSRNILDLTGGIALFIIIIMILLTNEYGDFLYYGGLMLLSILSAILIAVLAHPASRLAQLMGCKPLRWIGVRSYSLYIWHYPVIMLTNPTIDTGESSGLRVVLQLGASLLLSSLSWKYVEEPIRHGLLGRLWRKISRTRQLRFRPLSFLIVGSLVLFSISCNNTVEAPASVQPSIDAAIPVVKVIPKHEDHSKTIEETKIPSDLSTTPNPKDPPSNPQPIKEKAGHGVIAIGDSVILDAAPYLENILPGIVIDGKVGRQMAQAQEVVDNLKSNEQLGSRVIIELGTNGAFNTKQLRRLLTSLEDIQQIVLVNIRVPRKWQDTVNSAITKIAADFPNVTVVDWYASSKGKDMYFYNDGVHLRKEGAEIYASLVAKAVQKEKPLHAQ